MLAAFLDHVHAHFPFLMKGRLLVACSGGMDSMVLSSLVRRSGFDFALAHCNFRLRERQSDGDAAFVRSWTEEHGIPVFIREFDTVAFANRSAGKAGAQKISTQMAARKLRYAWFDQLCIQEGYDYILTAHHADDALETFLINLSRGSGIKGLQGIPSKNGKIMRPLLDFSRVQIEDYAIKNTVLWREDTSNQSDHYLRNHLRHHAIPALKEAVPHLLDGFKKSCGHLQASQQLGEAYLAGISPHLVTRTSTGYQLNIPFLKTLPHQRQVLYAFLGPFGFTAWEDIYALADAQTGRQIISASHRLIKDRNVLLLVENHAPQTEEIHVDTCDGKVQINNGILYMQSVDDLANLKPKEAIFDTADLNFPLKIRSWKSGDYFHPFGLTGKKKLSKFFKDNRFNQIEKESVRLLCNGDDIIWIIGHRGDERYRVKRAKGDFIKFSVDYDN